MKADTFKLARDIARGKWLIAYPDSLIPIARAFLSKMPMEMEANSPVPYYEIQGEKFGKGCCDVVKDRKNESHSQRWRSTELSWKRAADHARHRHLDRRPAA
ncbi:MAG: hypothetical protein J6N54_10040 [Bacteroidales bacterium]|nr:hypothetical protein [Bacteroidales bacterium]